MDLRTQYNQIVPENEKLSVNDFIVKAVALTLRQFPNLNASLNGNSVLRHGQVNIGIAVSVEGGLLTIVCREADQKPLRQISAEVKAMAARVREGKVKPEDIEGSTFSISNMGMYDVENFAAIINPPEAAILAVGSAREVPVVEGGGDAQGRLADESHHFGGPPRQRRGGGSQIHAGAGGVPGRAAAADYMRNKSPFPSRKRALNSYYYGAALV